MDIAANLTTKQIFQGLGIRYQEWTCVECKQEWVTAYSDTPGTKMIKCEKCGWNPYKNMRIIEFKSSPDADWKSDILEYIFNNPLKKSEIFSET